MHRRWARRLVGTVSGALVLLAAAAGLGTFASAAAPTGQVYLVQAIAGTTAQVVVDGTVVHAAASPRTVVGPLALAAGAHVVQLRTGTSALVSARFTVAAGAGVDVVAHRASDAAMSPVITVFRNDLAPVGPGKTRLVVSHVAVAEPADIRVDGTPFFRNVANGESLSLVVPARTYAIDVVSTAGGRTVLAPVRVTLGAGTLTRVFAFGNPDQHTGDAIVQVLRVPVVGAARPSGVHTGDGGQAADRIAGPGTPVWPAVTAGFAALCVAGLAGAARGSTRSVLATLPATRPVADGPSPAVPERPAR